MAKTFYILTIFGRGSELHSNHDQGTGMHGSPPSSQSEDENFEITLATTAPEVHMFQYQT